MCSRVFPRLCAWASNILFRGRSALRAILVLESGGAALCPIQGAPDLSTGTSECIDPLHMAASLALPSLSRSIIPLDLEG